MTTGARYCPSCGTPVPEPDRTPSPAYASPAPARRSRTGLVIAIVIVAVVAIIAIAAAAMLTNNSQPSDQGMTLSVTKVVDPAEGTLPADSGNRYIQITVEMTNGAGADVALNSSDFQLLCDDGFYYEPSEYVTMDIPSRIAAGSTAVLTIGFEIPESSLPEKIVFNGQYA